MGQERGQPPTRLGQLCPVLKSGQELAKWEGERGFEASGHPSWHGALGARTQRASSCGAVGAQGQGSPRVQDPPACQPFLGILTSDPTSQRQTRMDSANPLLGPAWRELCHVPLPGVPVSFPQRLLP